MRFEKEVSIFAENAILKRFQANETNFSVVQGKISAIISESEITELQNGNITMYDKLGEVEQTAGGVKSKFETFQTEYNQAKEEYEKFEKSTSEYIQTSSQFQTTVENYMKTTDDKVDDIKTVASQTADKFTWLVASGESKTDFTLTDRVAELITESLTIKSPDGSKTIISGGKMDIEQIFAQDIYASGTIHSLNLEGSTITGADITADSITANQSYSIYNGNSNRKIIYYDGSVKIGLLNDANTYDGAGFEFLGDKTINVYGHMYTQGYDIDVAGVNASGEAHFEKSVSVGNNISTGGNYNGSGYVQCNGLINTYSEYQSCKGTGQRDWRFGSNTGTGDSNWFGFYDYTSGFHGGIYGPDHSLRMEGEIIGKSANAFRAVQGYFGLVMRNDGTNFYFMPTNEGDPYGAWHEKNYSFINLATGQWTFKDNRDHQLYPVLTATTDNYRITSLQLSGNNLRFNCGDGVSRYCTGTTSDIRLKDNINAVEVMDALSVINSIKLHSFDWKGNGEHQRIGFIADELEQLDPKFAVGGGMTEDGEINAKVVDTFYLIGYIVKALQEMSAKLNS